MTTNVDIGSLIVLTPGVHGGRPRVAGTGVTVSRIVLWHKLGLEPEEIASRVNNVHYPDVAEVFFPDEVDP